METINLTCIGCPMGCPLTVTMENGEVKDVTGNTCKRGDDYARKEVTNPTRIVTSTASILPPSQITVLVTNPTRIVTSTVICEGGKIDAVSVKTKSDIPKGKIFDVCRALKGVAVPAPVKIGDVIIKDVAGTGVDIIATKQVDKA